MMEAKASWRFCAGAALIPNPTSIVTTVAGRVATVAGVGAGRAAAAVGLVATAMGVVAAVGAGGGDGVAMFTLGR